MDGQTPCHPICFHGLWPGELKTIKSLLGFLLHHWIQTRDLFHKQRSEERRVGKSGDLGGCRIIKKKK